MGDNSEETGEEDKSNYNEGGLWVVFELAVLSCMSVVVGGRGLSLGSGLGALKRRNMGGNQLL